MSGRCMYRNERKPEMTQQIFSGVEDPKIKLENTTIYILKILDKSTPVLYNINNHYCYYRRKECAYGCIKIQQTARIH